MRAARGRVPVPERGRAGSASPSHRQRRADNPPVCTCSAVCAHERCHGRGGCEACALAWLIDQDDRALWNERGQLVAPENLPASARTVHDPRQLSLRFERSAPEKHHG